MTGAHGASGMSSPNGIHTPSNGDTHVHDIHRLSASGLRLGYSGATVVNDVDLDIRPGALTALVGANASGKSTLLRGLARLMSPMAGVVTLDGVPLGDLPTRQVARSIGILPQSPTAPDGIRVWELVAHGRYPHQSLFRSQNSGDMAAIAAALESTGCGPLANRRMDELSGGQRQRVWIAMALAQQPAILLLDEPTSALDIAHQVEVLDVLRTEVQRGMTVVLVIHDLTLAARYADDLVVMANGRIVASGSPASTLTPDVVKGAFGVDALILPDPDTGRPIVLPRASGHVGNLTTKASLT